MGKEGNEEKGGKVGNGGKWEKEKGANGKIGKEGKWEKGGNGEKEIKGEKGAKGKKVIKDGEEGIYYVLWRRERMYKRE